MRPASATGGAQWTLTVAGIPSLLSEQTSLQQHETPRRKNSSLLPSYSTTSGQQNHFISGLKLDFGSSLQSAPSQKENLAGLQASCLSGRRTRRSI